MTDIRTNQETEEAAVKEYWHKYFTKDGHCSVCGNLGVIDTRVTARTTAGYYCGAVQYCFCPNGQMLRNNMVRSAEEYFKTYVDSINSSLRARARSGSF